MTRLRENLAITAFWLAFYAFLYLCYQVGSL